MTLPQPSDSPAYVMVEYDSTLIEYAVGALELLTQTSTFDENSATIEATIARFSQLIIDLQTPVIMTTDTWSYTIAVESIGATVGSQWTVTDSIVNNVPFVRLLLNNTTPAIGDKLVYDVELLDGVYTILLRYVKSSVYGIYRLSFGGSTVDIDCYNASFTLASYFLASQGLSSGINSTAFELECIGKNAASTGYYCGILDVIITKIV